MEKHQDWYLTACVFLFLSLSSQIQSTTQTHFLNHINAVRRVNMPSPQTTKSGVNQKDNDLIKKLPGQPFVNFKQYGGYVVVNETAGRHLYYYFVEAIKANASTPLAIWFNGGPGCSSLRGAFLEHGPFRIHSDGKTLYSNPYSWNNEVNMLYLESPARVGFSYTNTPDDNEGDTRTAEENYEFLVKWLERFPEYKGREFYITGQSYAGHYGPQLAHIILQRNNQTFINLRGVFIGNPGLDKKIEDIYQEKFFLDHAVYTQESLDVHKKACSPKHPTMKEFEECKKATYYLMNLENDLDIYNIYAPRCLNPTLTSKPKSQTTVLDFDPCSVNYMTAYLNRQDVQKAMHANTTNIPYPWTTCAKGRNDNWNNTDPFVSILPILHELMQKSVKVMVYSGDIDGAVPLVSTMNVLKKMNLTIEKPWRAWASEGEVGGYIEEYKGNFTLATVRRAGHDVPSDQPIRALTLFTSFIRNVPLLGFTSMFG